MLLTSVLVYIEPLEWRWSSDRRKISLFHPHFFIATIYHSGQKTRELILPSNLVVPLCSDTVIRFKTKINTHSSQLQLNICAFNVSTLCPFPNQRSNSF